MATQIQVQGTSQATQVTYGQVEAALKALPVTLLPEVYEFLLNLVEDADDLAMIDARRDESTRPAEEFFDELDSEDKV